MMRHCLDCGVLVDGDTRCPPHRRARDRQFSRQGRARRGPRWNTQSRAFRTYWAALGIGCLDASDGLCRGKLQVDHLVPGAPVFGPRCAYHNNRKGNRI